MKHSIKKPFTPRIDSRLFPIPQNESAKTAIPYATNQKRIPRSFLPMLAAAAVLLLACQAVSLPLGKTNPSAPAETAVPLPTISPISSPSGLSLPTSTVTPRTPTVEPPPFLSGFLTEVHIDLTDNFNTLDNWHTFNPEDGTVSDGIFVLNGKADWNSGFVFNQPLTEGYGVIISFKTKNNADMKSEFIFNTGEFNTDNFRQFGFYNGRNPQTNLFQGKNGIGYVILEGNLSLVANSWYSVFMAIGKNGDLLAVVWNPADPTKRLVHHAKMGGKWAGLEWQFLAQADIGETVYLKDFYRFTFGEINISNP
jgi:hypothetical protein